MHVLNWIMNEELVRKLKSSSDFNEFMDYALRKISELDTVKGSIKLSRNRAGELAQAREMAKDTLLEMFEPFVNLQEKKEPTQKEIEEAHRRVGLDNG